MSIQTGDIVSQRPAPSSNSEFSTHRGLCYTAVANLRLCAGFGDEQKHHIGRALEGHEWANRSSSILK